MAEIKFQFCVDKSAAIKKGMQEHGTVIRKFDLTALPQEDRDLLAAHVQELGAGRGGDPDTLVVRKAGQPWPLTAEGDTVEDVLAALRDVGAARAKVDAAHAAEADAEVERLEAEDRETLATGRLRSCTVGGIHPDGSGRYVYWKPLFETHTIHAVADRLVTRRSAAWKAKNAELFAAAVAAEVEAHAEAQAAKAAKAKARAEREAKEKAEVAAWAAEHGSERLKACVANGWECKAVYRDERLALETPDWRWDGGHLPPWDAPRNPPADAVALFEKAKATLPADCVDTAALVYWTHKDDDGDTETGHAVVARPAWADDDIVYGYTGPEIDD